MPNLHEIFLALRSPDTYPILDTIRYALARDRLNRITARRKRSHPPVLPGSLTACTIIPQGALFTYENSQLEVTFLAPDLVRLSWMKAGNMEPPLPYAIANTEWSPHDVSLVTTPEQTTLTSSAIELCITSDGTTVFSSRSGDLLRVEEPPESHGEAWSSRARLRAEEAVFGLGEHSGSLNLRGQSHQLWNTDPGGKYGVSTDPIYMPIPIYLGVHSLGSYLVFYENYQRGEVYIDPAGTESTHITFRFEGGMLRQYFIAGTLPHVLERYTELTGRAPLPPRWSLGYHQSRWGYRNDQDIREVLAGFREQDMPLSAIHLDIDYMDGYRVFTVNRERFPGLASLTQELKDAGVKTVTIIDPGVKSDPGFDVYQEGLRRDAFCRLPDGELFTGLVWPGWTVFPDFTHPEIRHWWGEYYRRLLDAGVAGIWHDMNEPCSFAAWGGLHLPDALQHHLEGKGGDHTVAHNIYGMQMNRACFEAIQRLRPEQRPWVVSRSGWAGGQRYAWNWTGDTESTWQGLKQTIATVLNLGLSGFPYSGPDIGGFSGEPSAELYLRWFQLATFMPFFRTHSASGTPRREPWVYGEPYTQIMRKFLRLRYQLLPYWYSLSWEAAQTGHPLVRPRGWYAKDGAFTDLPGSQPADAFYLGSAIFIAPILEPGEHLRQVRLPEGGWYDFWEDKYFEGGISTDILPQLERIPVFIRAGSLIPLQEGTTLQLHIYTSQPNAVSGNLAQYTSVIFSDSGDDYGPWRLDNFEIKQSEGRLSITWESQGEYPLPYERVEITLHGARPVKALVDNQETGLSNGAVKTAKFNKAQIEVAISRN
jgi:alpha-glucosidase